jgi:hypothetical protein
MRLEESGTLKNPAGINYKAKNEKGFLENKGGNV